MAVSTLPPVLKSQPAVEKLNTFTGCMVTVTRHMTPRSINGQSVLPTQPMTLKQLLELQTTLPLQFGHGYYHFNVVDQGGTGSDEWMVKLGTEQPEGFPMANLPGGPMSPGVQPPLGEGVINLGNGFIFNEVLGLLTTPWKRIVTWKQGDPFPEPPPTLPGQSPLSLVPPNATPWGQQPQPWWQAGGGGWSNIPVGENEEVKLLKQQNEEYRRQQERDEQRRREEERDRRAEEREAARAAEFKALITALTSKPTGPDPAVEELKRQNEEIRRQAAETQRRLEESQREDRLRAEITATNQRIEAMVRELASNKSDPMLTMMMQMMSQANAAATESMRAIQAAQSDANSATERSTQQLVAQLQATIMSPVQTMQLMQQAKGDGTEAGRMLVEGAKEMMGMQKAVYEQMLDVAGQGNQPPWVSVVQGALDKVGQIGQAIAEKQERAAAQPEYVPPRRPQPVQQQRVAQGPAPVAGPAARTPVAPIPATVNPTLNKTAERPAGTKYDAKSEEFVLADGRRIKQKDVEMDGWGAVLNDPDRNGIGRHPAPTVVAPEAAAALDASLNGAGGHVEAPPPTPISSARKPAKGRKKRVAAVEPAQEEGYSIEQLREMEADEIRAATSKFDDDAFFGVLASFVPQMRSANGGRPPVIEVAKYVKQAEEYVKRSGKPLPPAIELLYAEHIEVLVERIFPGADQKYIDEVGEAIAEIFGIGGDDDDDQEEAGGE